jgi:hypothetical protein
MRNLTRIAIVPLWRMVLYKNVHLRIAEASWLTLLMLLNCIRDVPCSNSGLGALFLD